jgi:hypothetical protein
VVELSQSQSILEHDLRLSLNRGVRVEVGRSSRYWPLFFETETRADGSFSFTRVPTWMSQGVTVSLGKSGGSATEHRIGVQGPRDGNTLTGSLPRSFVRVKGRVTRLGTPLAQVAFRRPLRRGDVYPSAQARWRPEPMPAEVVTDADRQFEALLSPASYNVMVESLDGRHKYGVQTLVVPDEDDARLDLSIPAGTTVSGLVRDKRTKKAVAGTVVSIRRRSGAARHWLGPFSPHDRRRPWSIASHLGRRLVAIRTQRRSRQMLVGPASGANP